MRYAMAPLALLAAMAALSAPGQEVRYHGFQMDEAHKLILEEEDGEIRVTLVWRARPIGGRPVPLSREDAGAFGRYTRRRELVRIHARVTQPAAPNYFSNPGAEYELRVRGVEVAPEFHAKKRLLASGARLWLAKQFERLRAEAHDPVDQLTLRHAEGAVMMLLHKAGRFPPEISETVKRSLAGRVRLEEGTQERRRLPTDSPMVERLRPRGPQTEETPGPQGTEEGVVRRSPGAGEPLDIRPRAPEEAGREEEKARVAPGAAAGVNY